jgi:hypothetical protein
VQHALPSVAELLEAGRLVRQEADVRALGEALEVAARDIEAADANRDTFTPWADVMLYEAGLRSARVIVQAAGFRIDAGARAHMTAIDAADALTGHRHHRLFARLHRMRRRRNNFMYDTAPDPSEQDLAQARLDVQAVVALARAALEAAR